MSKWVCEKCGDGKRCTVDTDLRYPFCCPVDGWRAKWELVEETSVTKESATSSLPEWCVEGEWVWFTGNCVASPKYLKIHEIKSEDEYVVAENGKCYWIDQLEPARLRPYDVAALQDLVGTVVRTQDGDASMVTDYSRSLQRVFIYDTWYNSKELAESNWRLDGSPCGVLERGKGN